RVERLRHDAPGPAGPVVEVPVQEEGERAGIRELRRAAEPAVAEVEGVGERLDGVFDERGRKLARRTLRLRVRGDPGPDLARRPDRALALLAPDPRDLLEDPPERWAAETVVGREVRAAVEDLALRGQERGERPAALPADRLDRVLIAGVDVGPLVTGDLDRDEVLIDQPRGLGVVVALGVHDVTPVAPDAADVEEDRAPLGPCALEHPRAPRQPVDRLRRAVPEERARRFGQGWDRVCRHGALPRAGGGDGWLTGRAPANASWRRRRGRGSRRGRPGWGRVPRRRRPRTVAAAPCRRAGRARSGGARHRPRAHGAGSP